MHKSIISSSRKRILLLAAAALLIAPSLSLPAAKAEPAAVFAPAASPGAVQPSTTASPQASQTPAPVTGTPSSSGNAALPPTGQEPGDRSAPTVGEESNAQSPAEGGFAADSVEPGAPAAPAAPAPLIPSTRPTGTPAPQPAAPPAAKPTTPAAKPTPAPAKPEAPAPFYDIVNDPNRDAIMTLYNEQIVKPAKDRKFRPKAEIGRADFTVILGRSMNANGSIFDVYFKDPIPDWAIRYVGGLTAAGIYEGYLDGDAFGPKQPVTRAEAAAMVARAAHLEAQPLPEGLGGVSNIPYWALNDVGAAYAAGLITTTETGTLNPNKKVTRSEMAAMIAPLLETKAFLTPIKIEEDDTRPPTMPPL